MPQGRRGQKPPVPSKRVTQRVVLERVRVVLVPDAIEGTGGTPLPADGDALAEQEIVEAWVVRDEQPGDRMKDAIEKYVKPGTPEQRAGEFKAVPLSNWKGGRRYKLPEQVSLIGESID